MNLEKMGYYRLAELHQRLNVNTANEMEIVIRNIVKGRAYERKAKKIYEALNEMARIRKHMAKKSWQQD